MLCFPACTFSAQLQESGDDEVAPDSGVMPSPSTRCTAANLELCIEFEGSNKDALGAAIAAVNVAPMTRFPQELAVRMGEMSSFKIGDTQRLDIANRLTIEMWTRPTEAPENQSGLFDTHLQYAMSLENDRRIECELWDSDRNDKVDSDKQLSLDNWHHVACTYDGAVLKVYVDGRLEGCRQRSGAIPTQGTFGSAIGANMAVGPTYTNAFVGELDNVHVYSRALTSQEICALWGNGSCDDECPLISRGPD